MSLLDLIHKSGVKGDTDFLREGLKVLAEAIMEIEVSSKAGAERYERSADRTTYRNGYREREWDTRIGSLDLRIPKLREGSYFPSILEPRKKAEKALAAVLQEAYVLGVSTRKVDGVGVPPPAPLNFVVNCGPGLPERVRSGSVSFSADPLVYIPNPETLTTSDLQLVGVTGFEPATSWSRTKRATKLRYTPLSRLGCRDASNMVGLAGFEPTTSSTPRKRATKLRYSPNKSGRVGTRPASGGEGGIRTLGTVLAVHSISSAAP